MFRLFRGSFLCRLKTIHELHEIAFDDAAVVIYYARQHWKGGDSKYMSSYHSEVAAA